MSFAQPGFLLMLPLLLLIAWRWLKKSSLESIPFSTAASQWNPKPTWKQRLVWLPRALAWVALCVMILALARPRFGRERTIVNSEGIAIEILIDRSSSMQALDFRIKDQPVDRLTAVKNVATKFVVGDTDDTSQSLAGRVADLVGLVVFAGYADAVSPPTLDHAFLINRVEATRIVDQRGEDGTAIGDAISLAVVKLTSLDQRQSEKVAAKVIILLTDGANTAGQIEPKQAAELAKSKQIKIYTIGVGSKGLAPYPVRRLPDGRVQIQNVPVNIDESTLQMIAEQTGGKYFRATDTQSLVRVYEEIDQLEKSKVDAQTFFDYRELAVQSSSWHGIWFPPLLVVAICSLGCGVLFDEIVLRRLS